MKAIRKSTLFKLARIVRGYARTGDVELLFAKNETASELAIQAYGKNDAWSAFADFVYTVVHNLWLRVPKLQTIASRVFSVCFLHSLWAGA